MNMAVAGKPPTFLLYLILSFIFPQHFLPAIASNLTGLKLKLFRSSPQNLTFEERCAMYERIATSRAAFYSKSLISTSAFDDKDTVRPHVAATMEGRYYSVEIMIGTPPKSTPLLLDTGADLTWTQCLPKITHFFQRFPIFDPSASETYHYLPLNSEFCRYFPPPKPQGDRCDYVLRYGVATPATRVPVTLGTLSIETFSFAKDDPRLGYEQFPGIVFGCGHVNKNFNCWQGYMTGIFGINKSKVSMIRQMSAVHGYRARFSYCLRRGEDVPGQQLYSFLRIGDNIPMSSQGIQRTTFIGGANEQHYYLDLVGVGINGDLLAIPQAAFHRRAGGGGCIIDSGCPFTLIDEVPFNLISITIQHHLKDFPPLENCPFRPCYRLPPTYNIRQLPSLQFYFNGGAVLDVPPENLFTVNPTERYFMLAIRKSVMTVIGAKQQHDKRFLYDLEADQLSWKAEECDRDI